MRRSKKNTMDSNLQESITLSKIIRITSVTDQKNDWWIKSLQILLMWIGVYIPISCFASSFDLGYKKDIFFIASIATALCYWLIFYFYTYLKYTLPLGLLAIVFVGIKYQKYLQNGFYYLENAVIYRLNEYFNLSILRYQTELPKDLCLTLLLIVFIQFLALVLALLIVRQRVAFVYIFISAVFVFSGFLVGVVPNPYAFISYTIYMIAIISMGSGVLHKKIYSKSNINLIKDMKVEYRQVIRIKVGVLVGSLLALLCLILSVLFTPKDFEQHVSFTDTKSKIQSKIMDFSMEEVIKDIEKVFGEIKFFQGNGSITIDSGNLTGGLDGGRLSAAADVEFANETVLKLTMPLSVRGLYLKGFAGAAYTKTAWEGLSKDQEKEYREIVQLYGSSKYTGENLTYSYLELLKNGVTEYNYGANNTLSVLTQYEIDIDYIKVNENFMYAPYFLDSSKLSDVSAVGDLYSKPGSPKSQYTFQYSKMLEGNNINEILSNLTEIQNTMHVKDNDAYIQFMKFEENYRKFVYETYVGIPAGKFKRLEEIELEVPKASDNSSKVAVINTVARYLAMNTRYTLSPGKLPSGEDYIEYFLFDSKKGYCAHYASAAVMLLRYFGVPARYVEGYIVTEEDIHKGKYGDNVSVMYYDQTGYENLMEVPITTVEIRDTNAHSWVEVYMDGIGWLPIEVTAGYYQNGGSNLNDTIANHILGIPSTTPLPTNTPKPSREELKEITKQPSSTPTSEPTSANNLTPTDIEESNGPTMDKLKTEKELSGPFHQLAKIVRVAIILFIISSILICIVILRYFILRYYKIKRSSGEPTVSAIYLYSQIETMLYINKFYKVDSESYQQFFERVAKEYDALPTGYEEMLSYVLKARFSNMELNKQEYSKVLSYYIAFKGEFYKQFGVLRGFYMKYWNNI